MVFINHVLFQVSGGGRAQKKGAVSPEEESEKEWIVKIITLMH